MYARIVTQYTVEWNPKSRINNLYIIKFDALIYYVLHTYHFQVHTRIDLLVKPHRKPFVGIWQTVHQEHIADLKVKTSVIIVKTTIRNYSLHYSAIVLY